MSILNIKFADGNELISYDDDTTSYGGCPTCDYGSEYINDITVETTNYRINATFNQMYEYAFTSGDAIRIFAKDFSRMTEDDFVKYLEGAFNGIKEDVTRWNFPSLKFTVTKKGA